MRVRLGLDFIEMDLCTPVMSLILVLTTAHRGTRIRRSLHISIPVFVQVPVMCICYSAGTGAVFKSEKDETAVTHRGISTVTC